MTKIRLILPVLALQAGVCFGQCNPHPLRPSILPPCASIMDQLGKAIDAAGDFKKGVAELNRSGDDARTRFWKVYPNGPGFDAAETAFLYWLWNKDMYYLMFALPQGIGGDMAKIPNVIGMDLSWLTSGSNASAPDINKFPTNVDGGIRPYAFPLFVAWVNALRRNEGREKDGNWATPLILATATRDRSNYRRAYEDARNWAELMSSGLDASKYLKPQEYLLHQMESDVALALAHGKPADLPDPAAATRELYDLFAKMFGEKEVLDAAATVLRAPKNSVGGLATRADVAVGNYLTAPSPDPFMLFLTQVTSSPRNYALALCIEQTSLMSRQASASFHTKDRWIAAQKAYGQLVDRFGEPAVLAAAARLKAVAKNTTGGVRGDPQSRDAIYWFRTLLLDPKTEVPDISLFRVSSYDPRWGGKMVQVRGTVSSVDLAKGKYPPYATIHFKESQNDKLTAYTPNSDALQEVYGDNLSVLVGKPLEVWGQVTGWNDTSGVRFLLASQVKVLNAGELASFRESDPAWMKLPLPVENLVDSPQYLAWKKFPAGSSVRYEERLLFEIDPGTDQYRRTKTADFTWRLDSINDERAVVVSNLTVRGRDSTVTFTYKSKEPPKVRNANASPLKTATGEETLAINGKAIATKWESSGPEDDPMTFTKTWRSDEVPGGLVLEHKQSHREIMTGKVYRSIEETIYAPVKGVSPELAGKALPAPTTSAAPPAPAAPRPAPAAPAPNPLAPVQARPGAPAPPDSAAETNAMMQSYSAVQIRASKARVALGRQQQMLLRQQLQVQRRRVTLDSVLPDDIVNARNRVDSEMREAIMAIRARDNSSADTHLHAAQDAVTIIENYLAR